MSVLNISAKLLSHYGNLDDIAQFAWTSTGRGENRTEKDRDKLLKQCLGGEKKHLIILERVKLDYELYVPIYVERHLDKYRMSEQVQFATPGRWDISQVERSLRYTRAKNMEFCGIPKDDGDGYWKLANEVVEDVFATYNAMMDRVKDLPNIKLKKRREEMIRSILPLGTMTTLKLACNLHSLYHILDQRLRPEAQFECEVTAFLMLQEALKKDLYPRILLDYEQVSEYHNIRRLLHEEANHQVAESDITWNNLL